MSKFVRSFIAVALCLAFTGVAFAEDFERCLHPQVRDRLGAVDVVIQWPTKLLGYQTVDPDLWRQLPLGPRPGDPPADEFLGTFEFLNKFEKRPPALSKMRKDRWDAHPVVDIARSHLPLRSYHERQQRFMAPYLMGSELLPWLHGGSVSTVESDDFKQVPELSPGSAVDAVLVVRLAPMISEDGRNVVVLAQAGLYHPTLGPEFTQFSRKLPYPKKPELSAAPWKEAPLVDTSLMIIETPGWKYHETRYEKDRKEEIAAIEAWYAGATAHAGKITREKLSIQRTKKLLQAEEPYYSEELSLERQLARWRSDGGDWLNTQLESRLDEVGSRLIEQLACSPPADETPMRVIVR